MLASASNSSSARALRSAGLSRVVSPFERRWDSRSVREISICLTCPTCLTYFEINRRNTGKQDWRVEKALVGAKPAALRQVRQVQRWQGFTVRQQW